MIGTLIDSSVILDIFTNDAKWFEWSDNAVERCAKQGNLYINEMVFAEVSVNFATIEELDEELPERTFRRIAVPFDAAFLAAKIHLQYRQAGGTRSTTLPDFFIGAHAAVSNFQLLTRDAARYRTYFPTVEVIAP